MDSGKDRTNLWIIQLLLGSCCPRCRNKEEEQKVSQVVAEYSNPQFQGVQFPYHPADLWVTSKWLAVCGPQKENLVGNTAVSLV